MDSETVSQLGIAVAQFAPHTDKSANLATLRELAAQAARAGARVVVAPEYAMLGLSRLDRRMIEAAEPLEGPFVTQLRDISGKLGIHLVAGVAEQLPGDDHIANTVVVSAPDGTLAAIYRKLHLFDAFGFAESDIVRPGEITDPATFVVDGIVFGVQTCFDVRFPESIRRLAAAGVEVLALPAQWLPGPLKEDHWTTLVRARAIENTMYVAAADHGAPRGAGNSMIVDPMGVVLCNLGDRTGVATADVSADRIREVRAHLPTLELRRLP